MISLEVEGEVEGSDCEVSGLDDEQLQTQNYKTPSRCPDCTLKAKNGS